MHTTLLPDSTLKSVIPWLFAFLPALAFCDIAGISPAPYHIKGSVNFPEYCFTQGFLLHKEHFYLSCGLYGESQILKMDKKGNVLLHQKVGEQYFLEDIWIINNELHAMTWKEETRFVLDPDTLAIKKKQPLAGELWGLTATQSGQPLITNGTSHISIYSPDWKLTGSISLVDGNHRPITGLNAMTLIDSLLLVNVIGSNELLIFPYTPDRTLKPATWIDLDPLNRRHTWSYRFSGITANGAAYDEKQQLLWVTGKKWGKAYAIAFSSDKWLKEKKKNDGFVERRPSTK